MSGAVKASGRPCSTIHDQRKARVNDLWIRTGGLLKRADGRNIFTREAVKEFNVAGSNRKHLDREKRIGTRGTRKIRSGSAGREPRNCTPKTRPEREAVANVAENKHETPIVCVCVFLYKQWPVRVLPIA